MLRSSIGNDLKILSVIKYDELYFMSRNEHFLISDKKRFVLFILLGYREQKIN